MKFCFSLTGRNNLLSPHQIFEKSKFATEIGAAVVLSPNAVRVLSKFGFSCERAQARQLQLWETVDGTTLKLLGEVDHREAEQKYGAPLYAIHRVDLHNELLRLIGEGSKKPATINLRSKVVDADPEKGFIELEDGTKHYADLIVAGDGLRSVLRKAVFKGKDVDAKPTGLSAFRFLIPTPEIESCPSLAALWQWKKSGVTIIADTTDTVNERHMVWYDCRRCVLLPYGINPFFKFLYIIDTFQWRSTKFGGNSPNENHS